VLDGQPIGYSRDVDAEADDPPGQPAQQANERKGLRALLGKALADEAAERADPGTATAKSPGAGHSGRADGTSARSVRSLRKGPGLLAGSGSEAETPMAGTGSEAETPMAGTGSEAETPMAGTGSEAETPMAGTGSEAETPMTGAQMPEAQPAGIEPADPQPSGWQRYRPAGNRALANTPNSRPLMSRPLINPHLRSDPRLRVWITRLVVALAVLAGFAIGLSWRVGLTAAIIYIAADSLLRSKTTSAVPAGVRVTSAQRFTRRRLRVLQPSGYVALHARAIPGTRHVIDHVVVGPAGVFALDSERLDRRLPIRAIGGMLYHGRTSMEGRFDHAQHEAKHASTLITAELGQRVRVRAVMVLYGPSISWVIMKVKGVDVFEGSRIGTYFRRQSKAVGEHRLNHSQIAMVLAAAARALPPLE
jgi:Nuclease-related domain